MSDGYTYTTISAARASSPRIGVVVLPRRARLDHRARHRQGRPHLHIAHGEVSVSHQPASRNGHR